MPQLAQAQPDPFEAAGFTDQGAAVSNDTGTVSNNTVDPFESAGFVDKGPGEMRATEPRGAVENFLTPFTSYPSTYSQMQREGREQMGAGIEQAGQAIRDDLQAPAHSLHMPVPSAAASDLNMLKGVGNVVQGAANYVTSPVNAALRTFVGTPGESLGVPKEYSEFAAGMALPIPKRLPSLGVATKADRTAHVTSMFDRADDLYDAARASPVTWTPQEIAGFKGDAVDALKEAGHRDFTAPKTFRALDELSTTDPSNASDVLAVRKMLSKIARSPDEGNAAATALKQVDSKLLNDVPEASAANATYAAAKRAETVHEALSRAELNAATSGSGLNEDNATRAAAKSIVTNLKARRSFSPDEIDQLTRISRGSFTGNGVRYLGNLLAGHGMSSAAVGAYELGPIGATAPAVGAGFKKLGSILTQRQVSQLDTLMRSRSPDALPKITNPLNDWSNASQAFEVSPVPRNLARLSIASRNLSNNLSDVGITIAPEHLIGLRPATAASSGSPRADEFFATTGAPNE
jgi:hypothetical protein